MRATLLTLLGAALVLTMVGCNGEPKESTATKPETTQTQTKQTEPVSQSPAAKTEPKEKTAKGKDGFVTTKSGLKYKDLKVGKGAAVKSGDTVTVDYTGWLDDGTVFDSSKKPGRDPFSFTVDGNMVIKGWDEGLKGMKVGGVRELTIPPDLGYGDADQGVIPPNSTLHFKIELHKIGQ